MQLDLDKLKEKMQSYIMEREKANQSYSQLTGAILALSAIIKEHESNIPVNTGEISNGEINHEDSQEPTQE